MARELAHFSIARASDDYLITIEDSNGGTTEFTADFDALDLISEAIEAALESDDDDVLAVDEDGDIEEEEE